MLDNKNFQQNHLKLGFTLTSGELLVCHKENHNPSPISQVLCQIQKCSWNTLGLRSKFSVQIILNLLSNYPRLIAQQNANFPSFIRVLLRGEGAPGGHKPWWCHPGRATRSIQRHPKWCCHLCITSFQRLQYSIWRGSIWKR